MKTHTGNCHCGKAKYEVGSDFKKIITCNCSHCHMRGLVLTFVKDNQMKILEGEDNLIDYQFNKKSIHHLSCSDCGIEYYGSTNMPLGTKMYAINLRGLMVI